MNTHLLVVLVVGRLAVAQTPTESNARLDALRETAKQLQSQMFGHPECVGEYRACISPQIKVLREALREYSVWKLNETGGRVDQLADDLGTVNNAWLTEKVVQSLGAEPSSPSERRPLVYRQKVPSGELIVIISDFRTMQVAAPAGEIIVQGFREEAGQYVFVRETGDSAFGIMDERKFQLLRSPLPNQIWVLITGQMGGFMGDLERVRIYSFDGVDFQERWAPEDSLNTELTVNGDEISSRYLEFKRRYLRGEEECIEEHVKLLQTGVTRTNLTRHGVCGDPRRIKLPGAIK